jgi:glycosyltransferase involved in cell wall biosynthesis
VSRLSVTHIVCTDAFAGTERYVLGSALNLAEAGCAVTVIGGDARSMSRPLADAGIDWLPGRTVPEALRSFRRIDRPDVINTHMTLADTAGVIAAYRRRIPVVSTRHFSSTRGSSAVARFISDRVARRITAQIAISDFVSHNIEGPNTVIYTGVDSAPLGTEARKPIVLVAQRFETEKFTEIALHAWARLTDRGAWRMQIAGDGTQREALVALANALEITDSVEFLGFRSDMDVLFEQSSIYFAPTPREGLGIAVIEAMAHGLPVVAARGGGHLESVGGVESPALFAPGDFVEAAIQLDRLIHDDEERHRYGDALRQRQRAVFNVRNQTEATLRLLTSAAARDVSS